MIRRAVLALGFIAVAIAAFARSGIPGNNPTLHPAASNPCTSTLIQSLAVAPSGAYALRCLNHQIPYAIRIRRASDSQVRDVGFVGNSLDTGLMMNFCAGTLCNIARWYDQSGHGRVVTPLSADASTSALIWTGGALAATIGGSPAGLMNSTYNNWFSTFNTPGDPTIMGANAGGILAVGNAASGLPGNAGQGWFLVPPIAAVTPSVLNTSNAGIFFIQGGSAFSPPSFISNRCLGVGGCSPDISIPISYTYGTDGVFAMRFDTADATPNKAYFNGGTPQTNASTSPNAASADITIGAIPSFPRPFVGKISEVYIFAAEPSLADTNIVGNNISAWFGLTWVNITT